MKTALSVIAFFGTLLFNPQSNLFAQAGIVTDPGAYAYLSEQVASAAQVEQSLNEQLKIFKEAKEVIDKISGALQSLQLMEQIISTQTNLVSQSKQSYSKLEQSGQFSTVELGIILRSFTNIITISAKNIKIANTVSQDGLLKMNDAERLKVLSEVAEKTNSASYDLTALENKYNRVASKKALVNTFK